MGIIVLMQFPREINKVKRDLAYILQPIQVKSLEEMRSMATRPPKTPPHL